MVAGPGALTAVESRFAVRLVPRGGSDRIDGVVDGVLRARVAAPAVAGAANHALLRMVAAELAVPPRDVRLIAGAGGRTKVVVVDGVAPSAVLRHWPGLRV